MALVVFGIIRGNIIVDSIEAVNVSYPNYFNDLKNIGVLIKKHKQ